MKRSNPDFASPRKLGHRRRWIAFVSAAMFAFAIARAQGTSAHSTLPEPHSIVVAQAAPGPQVLPRLSWSTFSKDPRRVSQLKKAIAYMKSLDGSDRNSANFRRSWVYWANIHGYYGYKKDGTTAGPDGTVEQAIAGYPITGFALNYYDGAAGFGPKITDQTPPDDGIAELVWATCEHSNTDSNGNLLPPQANFFGWHRMYLYYFEKVLQWAAGMPGAPDTTLRLPYWDYINPASVAVPPDFRPATSPLSDVKRAPGMNTGTKTLDPQSTNVNSLLTNSVFLGGQGFEFAIEYGIHGYVHCTVGYTCPAAYMGDVPVAGNDPIFYDHHGEIDRIWACWQKLHGLAGPPDETFAFVDASGNLVRNKVSNMLDTTKLGYTYESSDCTQPGTTLLKNRPRLATLAASASTVGSVKAVAITNALTTVRIPVANSPRLLKAMDELDTAQTFTLTLRDVSADSPPARSSPSTSPTRRTRRSAVKWVPSPGSGAFGHHGMHGPAHRTLTFDVTAALRALGVNSLGSKGATVLIEATTGRVAADGSAKSELNLAASAFGALAKKANVRVGAVELHGGQ